MVGTAVAEHSSPVTAEAVEQSAASAGTTVLSFDELVAANVAFAASFDPCLVAPERRGSFVEGATRMQSAWGTIAALTAAQIGRDDKFCQGYKDAADALASRSGVTRRDAERTLQTGKRLAEQDDVREAALAGRLSPRQAEAITDTVAVNPGAAAELLAGANGASLAELEELARKRKADVVDLEERRRTQHRQRSVSFYPDRDGLWHLHASGPAAVGMQIESALVALADKYYDKARGSGEHEPTAAYRFDALLGLATGEDQAVSSGSKVIIRIDKEALERGAVRQGELSEIDGSGPVAVSVAQDAVAAGAFLAVVVTGEDGSVERVAHLGVAKKARALLKDTVAFARAVEDKAVQVKGACHGARNLNSFEQTALEFSSPGCVVKGCPRHLRLERDHRNDFSKTRVTRHDEIDRLCQTHHDLKTQSNWMLVAGTGKREMVPPGDPRHPH
ncbi:MAG TPA: hypothetical protein VGS21_08080, partial [Acidimicrobiales bacterium]|nr:hypothetical protein [Acidimicrobiales bacterium]